LTIQITPHRDVTARQRADQFCANYGRRIILGLYKFPEVVGFERLFGQAYDLTEPFSASFWHNRSSPLSRV
jgi:hypothetical protein